MRKHIMNVQKLIGQAIAKLKSFAKQIFSSALHSEEKMIDYQAVITELENKHSDEFLTKSNIKKVVNTYNKQNEISGEDIQYTKQQKSELDLMCQKRKSARFIHPKNAKNVPDTQKHINIQTGKLIPEDIMYGMARKSNNHNKIRRYKNEMNQAMEVMYPEECYNYIIDFVVNNIAISDIETNILADIGIKVEKEYILDYFQEYTEDNRKSGYKCTKFAINYIYLSKDFYDNVIKSYITEKPPPDHMSATDIQKRLITEYGINLDQAEIEYMHLQFYKKPRKHISSNRNWEYYYDKDF